MVGAIVLALAGPDASEEGQPAAWVSWLRLLLGLGLLLVAVRQLRGRPRGDEEAPLPGAPFAYQLAPSRRVIAVVMALGTGLLIGSVSFELIHEALKTRTVAWVALYVLVGAAVFAVGDWLLTRRDGGDRQNAGGAQAEGSRWRSCSARSWTGSPSRSCLA